MLSGLVFFLLVMVKFKYTPNSFDHLSRPDGFDWKLAGLEPDHEPLHEPVVDVSPVH